MTISTTQQAIEVTEVGDVIMTAIVAEDANWVREFRVFGVPIEGESDAPLLFTLRVVAADKASLEVTTPQLQV